MRIRRAVVPLLLAVVAHPSPVDAETTVYFLGYAVEVPPPLVLLVCGFALISIGAWLRKLLSRTEAPKLELLHQIPDIPRPADAERVASRTPDPTE